MIDHVSPRWPRRWPLAFLALPAGVATWSGWVGLGEMTGFGPVKPLPGIADELTINSAVTLPIGVEAYAAFALSAYLTSAPISGTTRRFAGWSALAALVLGMFGQVAYHLLASTGRDSAPWWITTLVSCLPVLVLGAGAALAHMLHRDRSTRTPEPVESVELVALVEPDPDPSGPRPGKRAEPVELTPADPAGQGHDPDPDPVIVPAPRPVPAPALTPAGVKVAPGDPAGEGHDPDPDPARPVRWRDVLTMLDAVPNPPDPFEVTPTPASDPGPAPLAVSFLAPECDDSDEDEYLSEPENAAILDALRGDALARPVFLLARAPHDSDKVRIALTALGLDASQGEVIAWLAERGHAVQPENVKTVLRRERAKTTPPEPVAPVLQLHRGSE
ncbi:hypothetical protein AB0O28_39370 [Microbispora sp. NPDC088329]|uniref:hypothetical protein n=1 Tax=Microbispora sp. NPDC088329 TaxID=3154869 RepID=UPI003448513D